MGSLYERIEQLCERNGINITTMCREAGVSRGNLTDLKMGRQNGLSAKNTTKIANYFNVSVDYLLSGKETEKPTLEGEHKNRTKNLSMKIGEKLRMISASNLQRARQSSGYSVEKAAHLVDVDSKVIIGMENGTLDLKYGDKLLESLCDIYNTTPREILDSSDEDYLTDDEIKFALFGGYSGITDEMYNEVLQFAKFVKNREAQKKE